MAQQVGRGTRQNPVEDEYGNITYPKKNCLVIDMPCLTQQHELVHPVSLYDDSDTDDRVIARAKKLIDERVEPNLDAALAKAQSEIEELDRIRIKQQKVNIRPMFRYDPLSVMETLGVRPEKPEYRDIMQVRAPSPAMVNCLRKFKVQNPEGMSYNDARKLIGRLIDRSNEGLATLGQINYLASLGVPESEAKAMTLKSATAKLNELLGRGKSNG
jgi:hypothetical protein